LTLPNPAQHIILLVLCQYVFHIVCALKTSPLVFRADVEDMADKPDIKMVRAAAEKRRGVLANEDRQWDP